MKSGLVFWETFPQELRNTGKKNREREREEKEKYKMKNVKFNYLCVILILINLYLLLNLIHEDQLIDIWQF